MIIRNWPKNKALAGTQRPNSVEQKMNGVKDNISKYLVGGTGSACLWSSSSASLQIREKSSEKGRPFHSYSKFPILLTPTSINSTKFNTIGKIYSLFDRNLWYYIFGCVYSEWAVQLLWFKEGGGREEKHENNATVYCLLSKLAAGSILLLLNHPHCVCCSVSIVSWNSIAGRVFAAHSWFWSIQWTAFIQQIA